MHCAHSTAAARLSAARLCQSTEFNIRAKLFATVDTHNERNRILAYFLFSMSNVTRMISALQQMCYVLSSLLSPLQSLGFHFLGLVAYCGLLALIKLWPKMCVPKLECRSKLHTNNHSVDLFYLSVHICRSSKLFSTCAQMQDMRLLIFDEAHHAVKRHPYCMIMREFYHQAPRSERPRIFGMTASPVNIRAHHATEKIRLTIAELEDNLDAKVRNQGVGTRV